MSQPDDEAIEVVTSVGALDPAVGALREFVHRSAALRAVALVERPEGQPPAIVECGRFAPVEVDLGERVVQLAHDVRLEAPVPALPQIRRLPPFDVDEAAGEVVGTIGGLHHLADAVRGLADALGGRSVATAVFETTDAATQLALTARAGGEEPVVVALGEEQFELG